MKNILKFGFIFILAISLVSCGGDDDEGEATFTAKINGVEFVATNVTNGIITQNEQLGGQRFDVTASDDTNVFNFAISATVIDNCMPAIEYVGDSVLIYFSYKRAGGGTVQEHTHTDDAGLSTLKATITSCSGSKMSGTFSGTFSKIGSLQDEFVTPETVVITEGRFENVVYLKSL